MASNNLADDGVSPAGLRQNTDLIIRKAAVPSWDPNRRYKVKEHCNKISNLLAHATLSSFFSCLPRCSLFYNYTLSTAEFFHKFSTYLSALKMLSLILGNSISLWQWEHYFPNNEMSQDEITNKSIGIIDDSLLILKIRFIKILKSSYKLSLCRCSYVLSSNRDIHWLHPAVFIVQSILLYKELLYLELWMNQNSTGTHIRLSCSNFGG